MKTFKTFGLLITIIINTVACTDGASVSAGSDGTANNAAFDFSGLWNGTMTPNSNNLTATPAEISLSITQNSVEVEVGNPSEDEENQITNTRINASGVANIIGKCWNGGPIGSNSGQAAGTTVTFTIQESDNPEATTTFSGQFLGNRIEGNFTSSNGTCGTVSGSWTVRR